MQGIVVQGTHDLTLQTWISRLFIVPIGQVSCRCHEGRTVASSTTVAGSRQGMFRDPVPVYVLVGMTTMIVIEADVFEM